MLAGSILGWWAGAAFTLLLACACVSDLRTRRIPNALVGTIALVGLGVSLLTSPPLPALVRFAGGLATGLALWLPFWLVRWLGAGDVKLFAAAGAWLGAWLTVKAAVLAAVTGAVLSVGWLVWERGFGVAARAIALATLRPRAAGGVGRDVAERRRHLPYGVAMAIGLVVVWWYPSLLF